MRLATRQHMKGTYEGVVSAADRLGGAEREGVGQIQGLNAPSSMHEASTYQEFPGTPITLMGEQVTSNVSAWVFLACKV